MASWWCFGRLPRLTHVLPAAALLALTLVFAPTMACAQPPKAPEAPAATPGPPDELKRLSRLLPQDCIGYVRLSMASLAAHPTSRPVYEAIKTKEDFAGQFGLRPGDVRELIVIGYGETPDAMKIRLVIISREPITRERARNVRFQSIGVVAHAGSKYGQLAEGRAWALVLPDLLLVDDEAGIRSWLEERHRAADVPPWMMPAAKLTECQILAAVNPANVVRGDAATAEDQALIRSLTLAEGLAIGINAQDQLTIQAIIQARDPQAAAKLQQELQNLLVWLRAAAATSGKQHIGGNLVDFPKAAARMLPELIQGLSANAKATLRETELEFTLATKFDAATCRRLTQLPQEVLMQSFPVSEDVSSVFAVRESANRLKQLVVAMHQYHRKTGHFPSAIDYAPGSKVPHSWRVALLPYLDEQDLHDQYKFDEPWDSTHNRKLLEQVPEVFRSPGQDPASVNTSYFVYTGGGAMFDGDRSTKIDDVTDGARNTVLIVEALQNVPWTQPIDIPFDAAKPLPRPPGVHKEGFLTGLVSGDTLGFPFDYDEAKLKAVITKAGGEATSLQK